MAVKTSNNFVKISVFIAWTLVCLYMGIGGYVALEIENNHREAYLLPQKKVTRNNISYRNIEALQAFDDETKAMLFFYPLIEYLPKSMVYILTAMAFGSIGTITKLTKQMAFNGTQIKELPVFSAPLLGSLTGLLVLGIANLIPSILINTESDLNPLSLSFFSLLAGVSSEKFFNWLSKINDKIFS